MHRRRSPATCQWTSGVKGNLSTIRLKTLNCGGISSQTKSVVSKRRAIFNSIRSTTDITFLTETKFKKSDLPIYKREWGAGLLASCTPEVRAQAGVALLFRKGLAVTFLGDGNDRNGRVVWALVEINTKKLLRGQKRESVTILYRAQYGDRARFWWNSRQAEVLV